MSRPLFRALSEEKDKIEAAIQAVLDVLGPDGRTMPLVDAEGFPRSDVDVLAIRTARHQLACLQTDYSSVMERIKATLETIHEEDRTSGLHVPAAPSTKPTPAVCMSRPENVSMTLASSAGAGADASMSTRIPLLPSGTDSSAIALRPVAVAGAVVRGSPADVGGIRQLDEVLHFGSANAANTPTLELLLDLIRRSVGVSLKVVVRRSGEIIELTVTPGPWSGAGILGLHLLPPTSVA